MPIGVDKSQPINESDADSVKWFALTQFSVMAPLAAVVLCPPAAIPLAAVGAGIWKSYLKRTEHIVAD